MSWLLPIENKKGGKLGEAQGLVESFTMDIELGVINGDKPVAKLNEAKG